MCVCIFLSGLCACFEVMCRAGSEHSTDITCHIPRVTAAVVAILVAADAHSTSKNEQSTGIAHFLSSKPFKCTSDLLEPSHVLIYRYIYFFNRSCYPMR